tara:strand:- start:195 stop:371 length:177 start_codon:yes stop_codon:yes gene_type:complete
MTLFHFVDRLIRQVFIFFIYLYQLLISPFLGGNCRFNPTCSQYALLVLKKKELFLQLG